MENGQLKSKADQIRTALTKKYSVTRTALKFRTPIQILVATILSAQCTDARVNLVTKELFKKYKTVKDFANAKQSELEQDIRSTGFYKNKAKNIIGAAKKIMSDFNGKVPKEMEDLITLPGVARKTANIVQSSAYGIVTGIAVDTHVKRVSFRLGLTKHTDPVKIEQDLMQLFPQKEWDSMSLRFIFHGRNTCKSQKPRCYECFLNKLCPYTPKTKKEEVKK